jgi:putative membrane protein
VRSFLLSTVATAIAFAIVTRLLPDYLGYDGELIGLLVLAVIFGLVNGLIKPIVRLLALPVRMMTLGLIGFVINAGMLLVTAWIGDLVGLSFTVGDFPPTLLSLNTLIGAIIGAVALSIVNSLTHAIAPD